MKIKYTAPTYTQLMRILREAGLEKARVYKSRWDKSGAWAIVEAGI
jgi:hypothetical protein